jgi:Niemann-Pick C1 protein
VLCCFGAAVVIWLVLSIDPSIAEKKGKWSQTPGCHKSRDSRYLSQQKIYRSLLTSHDGAVHYLLRNKGMKKHHQEDRPAVGGGDMGVTVIETERTDTNGDDDDISFPRIDIELVPIEEEPARSDSISKTSHWPNRRRRFRSVLRRWVVRQLATLAGTAARYPRWTIVLSIVLAGGLAMIGYYTNARFDVDVNRLWTPSGTPTQQREKWIQQTFPSAPAQLTLLLHARPSSNNDNSSAINPTKNILTAGMVHRMFDALEAIQDLPLYGDLCGGGGTAKNATTATATTTTTTTTSNGTDPVNNHHSTCRIYGATGFWDHVRPKMTLTDAEALDAMSSLVTNDGSGYDIPTPHEQLFGRLERNGTSLIAAASARLFLQVPRVPKLTKKWERAAIKLILQLRRDDDDIGSDEDNSNGIAMQILGETSIQDELVRALEKDLPLVPIVVVLMTLCACWLLGVTMGLVAIAAVVLSILAGAGLMCILGVPWTTATQLLVFLMLGVGLDDAIVLHSTWRRICPGDDDNESSMEARVKQTIEECGLSIFLTTLTSLIAFLLGSFTSSVPAIYWLCQYCAPTVTLVLFFQLTFFVACLVLTEQQEQLAKCCTSHRLDTTTHPAMLDRFMGYYADALLSLPRILKLLIVVLFLGCFAFCISRIPMLTQDFNLQELLPADSYVADFFQAIERYSTGGEQLVPIDVYFLGFDYSKAAVRDQIRTKVQDGLIGQSDNNNATASFQGPLRSWMDAFEIYSTFFVLNGEEVPGSFASVLDRFLDHPLFGPAFGSDIVFDNDDNDTIIASRISLWLSVDPADVDRQLKTLEIANSFVTESMFSHHKIYNVWEFYAKIISEVVMTTTLGVIAVAIVSILFVPRWGSLHVIGMMCVLYCDLLGVVQLSGRYLSGITFICLCMSIGLLGDFCLHIVLRYEEGVQCCRDTLRSMGLPVLMGGVTTLLGILPLAFSTSEAFRTVFVIFLGIVTIGVSHALILLPLVLEATTTTTTTMTHSAIAKKLASNQ